jgi:hypothetical protein
MNTLHSGLAEGELFPLLRAAPEAVGRGGSVPARETLSVCA